MPNVKGISDLRFELGKGVSNLQLEHGHGADQLLGL